MFTVKCLDSVAESQQRHWRMHGQVRASKGDYSKLAIYEGNKMTSSDFFEFWHPSICALITSSYLLPEVE